MDPKSRTTVSIKVPHNLRLAPFQLSTTDGKLRLVGRGQEEAGADPWASKSVMTEAIADAPAGQTGIVVLLIL